MNPIKNIKDKTKRHKERYTGLDYQFAFADSIGFINKLDWDSIANRNSIFLSRKYFKAIEQAKPNNTQLKYAIVYDNGKPVVIFACQIAEVSGGQLTKIKSEKKQKVADQYRERIIVCGNLVSSGLHGVAFLEDFDDEQGWRIVAEIIYKIRRMEKLNGKIDFSMVKDIKGLKLEGSKVLERYSFRSIQTDPDMVLDLKPEWKNFDNYLADLTSRYRSKIRKIKKNLEKGGYYSELVTLDEALDKELHQLYLQVENKADVRLATLPEGYFLALQENFEKKFECHVIRNEENIVGFVSIIIDGEQAMAYYVGVDYEVNAKFPVYLRLLQVVIESGIANGCESVSFGRTALEPKASLGAKPVDAYIWARHRIPLVNFMARKLFKVIPYDEAPERSVLKQ